MRNVFMAGVAAISLATLPVIAAAQDNPTAPASMATMTPEQKTAYEVWAADRKADYDTWTPAQKSYFWSLDSQKQMGYWALTPEQRTQIQGLTPEQQTQAWASIAAQLSGEAATPPPAPAPGAVPPTGSDPMPATGGASTMPASTAPTGNTQFVSNAMVQGGMTTPTPQAEYPVCRGDVQDSCINPGAR